MHIYLSFPDYYRCYYIYLNESRSSYILNNSSMLYFYTEYETEVINYWNKNKYYSRRKYSASKLPGGRNSGWQKLRAAIFLRGAKFPLQIVHTAKFPLAEISSLRFFRAAIYPCRKTTCGEAIGGKFSRGEIKLVRQNQVLIVAGNFAAGNFCIRQFRRRKLHRTEFLPTVILATQIFRPFKSCLSSFIHSPFIQLFQQQEEMWKQSALPLY